MSTKTLHPAFLPSESLRYRLYGDADTNNHDKCIEWQKCLNPNGYGKIKIEGRSVDTHVASWRFVHGGIPVSVGFLVMHKCDNRKCINPSHLSIGTQQDNMQDCLAKGRVVYRSGENVAASVLTDSIVSEMKALDRARTHSQRAIARLFGFKYSVVRAALEGRTWKHVE